MEFAEFHEIIVFKAALKIRIAIGAKPPYKNVNRRHCLKQPFCAMHESIDRFLGNFHYPITSHPILGQVSQVDSIIRNNTSIKSQASIPQTTSVSQATRHQTPNTFINVFVFEMPQHGVNNNAMWMFLKALQL